MKFYYILLCVLILNCNKNTENAKTTFHEEATLKKEIVMQELDFNDIMKLSKKDAVEKYGAPNKTETEVLDNMHGEFYNNIQDAFIDSTVSPEFIQIEGLTWSKDAINNITVWYQILEESSAPKASLTWDKKAEF
ncbi:hypothetical protein [Lacinutrix sp. MEBiC02404]